MTDLLILPNLVLLALIVLLSFALTARRAATWSPTTRIIVFMIGTSLSLLTRLVIPITDVVNLRVGHVVVLGLWGLHFLRPSRSHRASGAIGLWPFVLLIVTMITSTWVNGGYGFETRGLVKSALLLIYVLGFAYVVVCVGRDPRVLRLSVLWFLAGISSYAAFHLALIAISVLRYGMDISHWLIGIRGLEFWNYASEDAYLALYGPGEASIVAAACILCTAVLFQGTEFHRRLWLVAGLVLLVTLTLSLSRAAWWGFVAGVAFLSGFSLVRPFLAPRALTVGMVIGAGVVILALTLRTAVPQWGLAERFATMVDISEGTGMGRWNQYKALLAASVEGPLLGHGAYSHLLLTEGLTAENFVLEFFYAAGWIGLACLLVALFMTFRAGLGRLLRISTPEDMRRFPWSLPLCAATVAVLSSSMLAAVVWVPQFWVLLGLMVASSRVDSLPALALRS